MKEYLVKNSSGNYQLVNHRFSEDDIDIPVGADCLTSCNNVLIFWKGQDYSFDMQDDKDWVYYADGSMTLDYYSNFYKENGVMILWKRESLNDKVATAEAARQQSKNIDTTLAERQSQYGSFEDVAFVTENIMATLAKVKSNGLQDLPHTHRMALYMIASKMARIVNGDFNHLDSWHDIGGYSKLIEDLITDSVTVDW